MIWKAGHASSEKVVNSEEKLKKSSEKIKKIQRREIFFFNLKNDLFLIKIN